MKVYIWGTGVMASEYVKKQEIAFDDILGFIESKKTRDIFVGKKVYEPQEITKLGGYDYILVCVRKASKEICRLCRAEGIDIDKLILMDNWEWMDGSLIDNNLPVCCRKIIENSYDIQKIFPEFYKSYLKEPEIQANRYMIISRNGYDLCEDNSPMLSEEFHTIEYQTDYFRYRTFELVANEIIKNKVKGDVAEVGVFRGTFSKLINMKFRNKKLYLFDTFDSFDINEFYEELEAGRVPEDFLEGFKKTNEGIVLNNMPYPDKCVIKKGLFPQTAAGLENKGYAFVSIDVDFEDSIYEGLKFFYPRLNHGGYIFIHDYNSAYLVGVRKAVLRYELDLGTKLNKVPIADRAGTLVIVK